MNNEELLVNKAGEAINQSLDGLKAALDNYQLAVGAYLEGIERANELWKSAQKSETCSEE